MDRRWAAAAEEVGRRGSGECAPRLESRWPGFSDLHSTGECSLRLARGLLRSSPAPEEIRTDGGARLGQWFFVVDVYRDERRLWSAAVGATHALPGVLQP